MGFIDLVFRKTTSREDMKWAWSPWRATFLVIFVVGTAPGISTRSEPSKMKLETVADSISESVLVAQTEADYLDAYGRALMAFTARAMEKDISDLHQEYKGMNSGSEDSFCNAILLSSAYFYAQKHEQTKLNHQKIRQHFHDSKALAEFSLGDVSHALMVMSSLLNPNELSITTLHSSLLPASVNEDHRSIATRFDSSPRDRGYALNVFLTAGTSLSRNSTVAKAHRQFEEALFHFSSESIDEAESALAAAVATAIGRPTKALAQVTRRIQNSESIPDYASLMLASAGLIRDLGESIQKNYRLLDSASARQIENEVSQSLQVMRGAVGKLESEVAAAAAALVLYQNPVITPDIAGITMLVLSLRPPAQ